MLRKLWLGAGLAAFLGGTLTARAQYAGTAPPNARTVISEEVLVMTPEPRDAGSKITLVQAPDTPAPTPPAVPESEPAQEQASTGYGPTPLAKVNIIMDSPVGDTLKSLGLELRGWLDADYTYRSTGHGINNIAPVMNRFGDEALLRQVGLYLSKPLDPKCLSWGFNAIFIAGSDASFLGPTAGGWKNPDPRFGSQFTDLNLTAHLPILTEGGVDVKAGRQTTILGPMGALPWQRYFTSSDYAWYNMEEGRYTGVSAIWHITKRLDWYNGIEFGWGQFFDYYSPAPQYITNISYWLDEDAKKTKVWTTVLTGPTGMFSTGDTTVLELGIQHNWTDRLYQIVDTQMVWSKAPIFFAKPVGYTENAYDVYTYIGYHINKCLDVNARFEWYNDVNGGGYPGGFGIPHTDYFSITVGPDYHPVKWLQFRPEFRYDTANHDAFGTNLNHKAQICLAVEALVKF
jgi:hypothetical protein